MIRARLRLVRQFLLALLLLGFLACSAEVGVRIYECSTGSSICELTAAPEVREPSGLAVPSWLANTELQPRASASVKCRDQRRTIEIQTNSLGLRGEEIAVPRPHDVFRIVVLGDETVFAPEIADEDHFTSRLAQALNHQSRIPIEVINAGVPDACPLSEYLLFKHKLLALQPNLVLVHFDWSDVHEDRRMRRRLMTDPEGIPLSCPHPSLQTVRKEPHALDRLRDKFRLVHWGLMSVGQHWQSSIHQQAAASRDTESNAYAWLRQPHPETEMSVLQSFQPLLDLSRLARSTYCPVVVFTTPKPWQVSVRCTNGAGARVAAGVAVDACYPSRAPFQALSDFCRQAQVPCCDLSEALIRGEPPESRFLKYAPRWSVSGHRVIAAELALILQDQVSGPWNSRYFQQDPGARLSTPSAVRWASGPE